jgi:thymidylate synthase
MQQYLELMNKILCEGQRRPSRAKLKDGSQPDTISLFGLNARYDLKAGFPLVTTKRIGMKGVVTELLWFIKGDTNIQYLLEHDVHIWDSWADKSGDLGPIYGKQWRDFNGVDQLTQLIDGLKSNPFGRRHIISAWNVSDLHKMALPPCHILTQFYVDAERNLSCHLYQRSGDMFLGIPWNIASYSLLTHMIAQVCGLGVGEFVHTIGDAHIYSNHIGAVQQQLVRECLPLPRLVLDESIKDIFDFKHEHIRVEDYQFHPSIKAEVAV